MSPYMARLRRLAGPDTLLVPSAAVLPRDDAGRVLLIRHADTELWADGEETMDAAWFSVSALGALHLNPFARACLRRQGFVR